MSVHFEKLTIKNIKRETKDCVSITLDVPEALKEKFSYKQGQHLTFRATINGEDVRRNYSLCSSPLDNEWKVAVKKTELGVFANYANEQLKAGDVLDVMPPLGHFFSELNSSNKKNYVLVAAGSGITPVMSIIKTILATEPQSSITLVYGNRHRNSIIFKEELEALKDKHTQRLSLVHILSREMTDSPIHHGRIDAEKCKLLFGKMISLQADEYFICGPEEMIFTVKDFLKDRGVDEKKIHFELFTSNTAKRTIDKTQLVQTDTQHKSSISIKLDGVSFNFEMPFNEDSVLDAAIQKGADLPYSCKGGMCATCKARITEGEVIMDHCYALEPEEVEEGYILTCQSFPKTEKVVIDFDIK